MIALVSLISIYGFALLFHIFAKRLVSVSIFFAISFIITTIFLFGMVDFLKYGTYFVFYGGILSFFLMLIKNNTKVLNFIISVPSVIYLVVSITYLYLIQDAHFFFWDEYSHWGAFIKEMYYFGHFYDANSVAANLSYPPGISIWDYFIVLPTGYKEGNIYFAYFLILFSSMLMMYEKLKWKQFYWIALIFVIQMVLFADFGHGFSSIYVDHVVGAMFTGLILSFIIEKNSIKSLYLFIFPLLALTLIKEVGFVLDLFFLGFVFVIHIINCSRENQLSYFQNIKNNKKTIAIIVMLFIFIFASLKAWNTRQESSGIYNNGITMSKIITYMAQPHNYKTEQIESEISRRFFHVFTSQQVSKNKNSLNYNEFSYNIMPTYKDTLKLTGLGVFFFIILFSIIIYFSTKKSERNYNLILINLFLIVIFIIHVGLLYLSYRNGFGSNGLRIPSYVRYINTIILPIFAVQFSLLLPMFNNKSKSIKKFNIAFASIIALIILTKPYISTLYTQLNNGFRKSADNATKIILEKVPSKAKLFVVFPIKNNGSLNNIIKYSLIPIHSKISKFDFENKSFQDMINIYSQYDYIWFAQLDKNLIEKNKAILKGKYNKTAFVLYKIEVLNKKIKLIPII